MRREPSNSGADVPQVSRNALVPYSAEAMYALVADIECYPEFLPWCRAAVRHQDSPTTISASLEVAKGPFRKTFTTENQLCAGKSISMELVDGPFRHLHGRWHFQPIHNLGCKVCLDMDFELSNRTLAKLLGPVFSEIANTMVDAFCKRAKQVYRVA